MPDYFNHHSITNHRHSGPKWLVAITAWLAATVVPILAQGPQLSLVAMAGTHIAGLEENEILRGWGFAKGINRRGEVIFTGGISKRDSDGNYTQAGFGIWCGKPGEIRLLARDGQALPGDDTALIFSELLPPLAFNNQGEVAFLARIGPDLRTHDATALFIGTPGKLRMVARDGDAAPGFENANGRLEFKTVFKRSDQTRLALSDTGALAWTAGVVQAENTIDFGVWLTKNGETELITPPP